MLAWASSPHSPVDLGGLLCLPSGRGWNVAYTPVCPRRGHALTYPSPTLLWVGQGAEEKQLSPPSLRAAVSGHRCGQSPPFPPRCQLLALPGSSLPLRAMASTSGYCCWTMALLRPPSWPLLLQRALGVGCWEQRSLQQTQGQEPHNLPSGS